MKTIKIPRFFKKKKFLAATARRASAASAGMDFDGIPEPNMKLSRALLVVLLLHVVAVSGIVAFNVIKTRESSFVPANPTQAESTPANTPAIANRAVYRHRPSRCGPKGKHAAYRRETFAFAFEAGTLDLICFIGKNLHCKKGRQSSHHREETESPVDDDLMSLNQIEDPHKLQIGQKLLIPERTNSKTTSAKANNHKKSK